MQPPKATPRRQQQQCLRCRSRCWQSLMRRAWEEGLPQGPCVFVFVFVCVFVCSRGRQSRTARHAFWLCLQSVCLPGVCLLLIARRSCCLEAWKPAVCGWPPPAARQLTMCLILLVLSLCVAVSDPACAVFLCCLAVWLFLTLYGCAVC